MKAIRPILIACAGSLAVGASIGAGATSGAEGKAGKTADLRGLMGDIAESADEIHAILEQFHHLVRVCSQIGY